MENSLAELAVDVGVEKEDAAAGNHGEEEDEYVLLDLEGVFHGAALPPNCAYTLSGLDTMNPVLTLGDDLKLAPKSPKPVSSPYEHGGPSVCDAYLNGQVFSWVGDCQERTYKIGEYEETVGTVLVFTEYDEEVPEEERIRGSKENGKRKRVSNFCNLERKLKFRMMDEKENEGTLGQEIRS